MKILVEIKTVYGNEMIYPVCEQAIKLCRLTGKKTFSRSDIATIKDLGFEVEVKSQSL